MFNDSSPGEAGGRIEILDLARAVCVAVMLVYHFVYDLCLFGYLDAALMETWPMAGVRWVFAGGFVLISGAAVRFSRNPVRRGFIVFCAGALVTVATAIIGYPVAFGVLHLLGVCMILYALLRTRLEKYNARPAFAAVNAALFAGTAVLTANVTVGVRFLYPLGFVYPGFFSADYYPLFPWAFLFLLGTSLGRWLDARRDAPALRKHWPKTLTFFGRHSLIIYLLHQPLYWLLLNLVISPNGGR